MPSLNRNFTSYLSLLPGITATLSTDSFGADSIRVNGQATQNANYMLDGAGNNDNFNNGNGGAQARTPVEAIQEFQLLTSQFDAEFGSTSGGVVNAVSKQGTNQLHGVGFFFNQNQAMTSLDYFAKQQNLAKPEAQQKQWGGNIGGPIVRNKLHFFVNLERIDQNRGPDHQHQRPSRAQFHRLHARQRVELDGSRGPPDQREQHVGGPLAARDVAADAISSWHDELHEGARRTGERRRLDHRRHAEFGAREHAGQHAEGLVHARGRVLRQSRVFRHRRSGGVARLSSCTRRLLDGSSTRANRRMDPAYQIDETFAWFLPEQEGRSRPQVRRELVLSAASHVRCRHAERHRSLFRRATGTSTPADPRTYPDRLQVRVPGVSDFFVKGKELGFFAQDKWKINSRLTASLGVRYDLEIVPLDKQATTCSPTPSQYPVDKNNVSPRVGATWTLDQAGTTVVRGGWGLYFQKTAYSNFMPTSSSAGAFTDSFLVNLCGPANAPICPSATSVDPGPSAGRLPTSPFLVNGPIVNRALLNSMFPPGTRLPNTGTVQLRQSGSAPAVVASGEHRDRESSSPATSPSAPTTFTPSIAISTCGRI